MATQTKFLVSTIIPALSSSASSLTFSPIGYTFATIQGYTDTADVKFQIVQTSREYDDGSPDWDYGSYGDGVIYAIPPGVTWTAPLGNFPLCSKYARINFLTTLGPVAADAICKCVVALQNEKGD